MKKWADQSRLRKRLVAWVDRRIKADPNFLMESFISGWLSNLPFDDMQDAVRLCDEESLYNLDWAKDELALSESK